MKQHTTQEQAKEFPVLPEPDVYEYDIETGMHVLKAHSTGQLQAYGQKCAAHAREMALEEAKKIADDVLGENNISLAIEALKGK